MRAERWRLAQAHELILRFSLTYGRQPKTADEVEQWALYRPIERPIRPGHAAFEEARSLEKQSLADQVADRLEVDRAD